MSSKDKFKPCKLHQYRDPVTNRCKNKIRVGSVKPSKNIESNYRPCKAHQYRDPVTNRCKNRSDYKRTRSPITSAKRTRSPITSAKRTRSPITSSKRTRSPITSSKRIYKPCKSHQYRDPITNRCKNKVRKSPDKVSKSRRVYKPCLSHQYRDSVTNRCKNKDAYNKKRSPSANVRVKPGIRWKYTKKVIGDCIKRSNLPLRDLQIKVVQYMDDHDSILVMHGTGTGKTLTSITTSQCYLDKYPDRKVVFVGPASLASNFKKELYRYGLKNIDKYFFYSFDKFYLEAKQGRPVNLQNSFLIIDEAHNLRNPLSKKSKSIVEASWRADKRMLLSATPFVNNLMDFIPLINIIYGRKIIGTLQEFHSGLCEEWISKNTSQDNLNTLKYLMRDKIDVFININNTDYPERFDYSLDVPMTDEYYARYSSIIKGENIYGILFNNPDKFYNGYRRAVNKAGPGYYSMKVRSIIPILKNGKSIVYTNWIDFGVGPITEALKENGVSYRVFSGGVNMNERQNIVDDFNNDLFQVLILTKAGGEGLDLKGVASVVVMDPTWNDASLQQIIGRAIRYKSHIHLPYDEQKVNVYYMVLTKPISIGTDEAIESGDSLLYNIIERKKELNIAIMAVLEDMSI
jgi:SNF2 family DNA or RNA helicase